jgi:hypothetical protein
VTPLKEIESLVKSLSLSEELLDKAIFRSTLRTLRKLSSELAKDAGKSLKVPQKLIRQRTYLSPRRSRLTIFTYDLPASILPFYATKSGIKIRGGNRAFPGSFKGKSQFGKLKFKIYKRLTSKSLPVKMEALEIKSEIENVIDVLKDSWIRDFFLKELLHEVKFRGGIFNKNV